MKICGIIDGVSGAVCGRDAHHSGLHTGLGRDGMRMQWMPGSADSSAPAPSDDAWKQLHDLQTRFSRSWKVRSDLEVDARGLDRCVLVNGEHHNVGTIREFVWVLEAACDFVDNANPKWAAHKGQVIHDPDFYRDDDE